MFERLLELFLHAKSGVIAGVFLVGTTGALVTATVQNGVTTITITQASPSPSGSVSPLISPSVSPSPSGTASASPSTSPSTSPSSSPSSSASANPCAAQAHAMADAVKTVDRAFSGFHTDLMHLREGGKGGDAARKSIEDADKLLKTIRQSAVKAIHATSNCRDDEDENDEDKDSEDHQGPDHHVTVTVVTTTSASPTPTASTSTTFTGDPKSIADQAVAAMKLVFDNAKASLPVPTATSSPRPSRTAEGDRRGDSGSNKGKSGEHRD